jgi:hypothetical protein
MKPLSLTAILLIVVGFLVLAYQGVSYTTRDKAIDIGPIQVSAERTKTIPLPPILGAAMLAGGILLLVTTKGRR